MTSQKKCALCGFMNGADQTTCQNCYQPLGQLNAAKPTTLGLRVLLISLIFGVISFVGLTLGVNLYEENHIAYQLGVSPLPKLPFILTVAETTYTGLGNEVIDLAGAGIPRMVSIRLNSASGQLTVWAVDENGNNTTQLVRTTNEPYDGFSPLDLKPDQATSQLRIESDANWTITILPLSNLDPIASIPVVQEGENSALLLSMHGSINIVNQKQEGQEDLIVRVYDLDGDSVDIIDTSTATDGLVIRFNEAVIDGEILIIEVQTVGPWGLQIF